MQGIWSVVNTPALSLSISLPVSSCRKVPEFVPRLNRIPVFHHSTIPVLDHRCMLMGSHRTREGKRNINIRTIICKRTIGMQLP